MSDDNLVDGLADEVLSVLTEFDVGLYEFSWFLRGQYPNMETERMLAISKRALEKILAQDAAVRLCLIKWADKSVEGAQPSDLVIRADDWNGARTGNLYLAITRSAGSQM